MTARNGNGRTPDVDLDRVLGDRAKVRTVKFGGRTYHFGPLSLVTARLLEQAEPEKALRSLLPNDAEYEAFINAVPAMSIDTAISAIYGVTAMGEASGRPTGSAPKKAASKPSKRTSRSAASRSPSS